MNTNIITYFCNKATIFDIIMLYLQYKHVFLCSFSIKIKDKRTPLKHEHLEQFVIVENTFKDISECILYVPIGT